MNVQFGRLLRLAAVCEQTGNSPATVYRKMKDGTFPLPVVLGPNSRAWVEAEIEALKAALIAARDDGADAELRVVNPNIGRGRPPGKRQKSHRAKTVQMEAPEALKHPSLLGRDERT